MKYNFKNIAFFATATLAMGAFSACSNEIENIDEQQKETKTITFTATLGEDDSLSRTSYVTQEDGSLKVSWKVGDKLYVGLASEGTEGEKGYVSIDANGSGYKTAEVKSVENGGKTAIFEMAVDDTWTDGQELNVFYGRKNNLQKNNNNNVIKIYCTNHNYNFDDFTGYLNEFDFMFARTTYNQKEQTLRDFKLERCVSFVKFNLKIENSLPSTFNVFSIETTDSKKVFTFYITVDNEGKVSLENTRTGLAFNSNSSNVNINTDKNGNAVVYMCVPPTESTTNFDLKITISKKEGDVISESYTGYLYNISPLEAGKIYDTPEITMNQQ